jgi:acetoin utilization deacetylase AcuC-like enzyme
MYPLTLYIARSGLRHDTGPGHPERPGRLHTLLELFGEPPFDALPQIDASPAETAWLRRAHDRHYIEAIENAIPDHGFAALDGDTIVSPASLDAALEAAGAVCQAVEDVASGKTRRAFCAVRPPGHHAEPARAMGFCLFNTIFIGARHAQEACGLRRIAIVDFDVHHGNGTETMTRNALKEKGTGELLFISSHQFPFWPGTGDPATNTDRIINMALAAGDGGNAFRRLYRETALPALDAFRPDLIMISAGFDAHRDDPLAQIDLVEEDFGWITRELCTIADRHALGRIVSTLEGGYDLAALKSSAAAHLSALMA